MKKPITSTDSTRVEPLNITDRQWIDVAAQIAPKPLPHERSFNQIQTTWKCGTTTCVNRLRTLKEQGLASRRKIGPYWYWTLTGKQAKSKA